MASSLLRPAALSRGAVARSRMFSTTKVFLNDVGATPVQKKPVGGFRGGIVGFLFGFSLASSFAAYHLLDEFKQASAALQVSVEKLQESTEAVTAHVRRIEAVEKDLKALANASASKDDASRIRAELKKLYDGLHVEFLKLRTDMWEVQQDVHSLSKKESTSVRV